MRSSRPTRRCGCGAASTRAGSSRSSNAKIFDEPVYNYTRDFPYSGTSWPCRSPTRPTAARAERILQEVAERHTVRIEQMSDESLREMQRRYFMKPAEMKPKVYYRLTDNWLELTVRFIAEDRGVRDAEGRA